MAGSDPKQEPELEEFARRPRFSLADPEFRDELRAELWEMWQRLLALLRG